MSVTKEPRAPDPTGDNTALESNRSAIIQAPSAGTIKRERLP